jgi:hypothetical protein
LMLVKWLSLWWREHFYQFFVSCQIVGNFALGDGASSRHHIPKM